jgi:hypothetical protein
MQHISRKHALAQGLSFYFTGKPCSHGHIAKRYTRSCECAECRRIMDARLYNENVAKRNMQAKLYKESRKEYVSMLSKKWKENNRALVRATMVKRHAAKLQRIPKWADLDAIEQVYKDCEIINVLSRMYGGEEFHVDHIIPMQGENVSGLHVFENLQIITATENLTKGNRWENNDE